MDFLFLIVVIIIVIASLLFLFFWNRFLGLLVSVILRLTYWKQGGASIWVTIGSIHFSLLAGRILYKDVYYHSSSQTIRIVKGQVSWRYWIRAPTLEEDLHAHAWDGEGVGGKDAFESSCRINIVVEGLEWFIYNRTAAYDNIISQMAKDDTPQGRSRSFSAGEQGPVHSKSSFGVDTDALYPPLTRTSTIPLKLKTPRFIHNISERIRTQLPNLDPKTMFPISFEGSKGAILCGNASTPSILVAEFRYAKGVFGIVPAKSKYDLYKQILNLKFNNASIRFAENDKYLKSMTVIGKNLHEHIANTPSFFYRISRSLSFSSFAKLWRHVKLKNFMYALMDSAKPKNTGAFNHPSSFRGRRKLPKSAEAEKQDYSEVEYAIERQILEAPALELSYYADAVGVVPADQRIVESEGCDVGNGDVSPEWGLDLVVHEGFLRYGPWADRQRVELQRTFFPMAYQDIPQTAYLRPGKNRIWTTLRVFVELRAGTTLYIPFREASKVGCNFLLFLFIRLHLCSSVFRYQDWQWEEHSEHPRPKKREAAYINFKAGDDSTISFLLPMVAGPDGYEPLLEVHLDTVVVSTSLNDIRLLMAESCRVQGGMHNPLKWNTDRLWRFGIFLRQPVLYLLRDHINMLTDLSKDWTSGPPSDYFTWVPMRYAIDLDLRNYEINTYVNDHNIIDKPLIRDENALLTLRGAVLRNEELIRSDRFRPPSNTIPFTIDAPDVEVSLTLPRWNTHRLHATEPTTKLGCIGHLRLEASYHYFADIRPDNIEQLRLNFFIKDVVFKCLGWSIRHLMILRDNYFGSFTHFSTLNEYLEKRRNGIAVGDPVELKYRPGKANMLQVELQLDLQRFLVIFPAGIPGYETYNPLPDQDPKDVSIGACAKFMIPDVQLQLRTHDYYMEMVLNGGIISGSIQAVCSERSLFEQPWSSHTKEAFIIDGLDIIANRLFGPQPRTSTYVCIWEISIGDIKGMLSVFEARVLQAAMDAFSLNFSDVLNAPAAEYAIPLDPDVTFMKVKLESVDLTLSSARVAIQASLPQGLSLERNDLAGNHYRKVTSLRLIEVQVRCLHRYGRRDRWIEVATLSLDGFADIYSCPPGWRQSANAQRDFVMEQDALTGRTQLLYPTQAKQGRRFTGNGIYTSVLRLPRPKRAANADAAPKARQTQDSDSQYPTDLTKPTPFSHRRFASDSEGEDTYMETDRDLRLASARPSLLKPAAHVDNESMSSGDESDNADLTTEGYSESGWSDSENGKFLGWCLSQPSLNTPSDTDDEFMDQPMVDEYANLSRHYVFLAKRPSAWGDAPFVLTRDCRPPHTHQGAREESPATIGPDQGLQWHIDVEAPDECDTTIIRLTSQAIDVWLTPLIPSVVHQIMEETSVQAMGPEFRMDSVMADHIRSFDSTSKADKSTVIGAALAAIRIRILQFTPAIREEATGMPPQNLKDASPPLAQDLTTVDVAIDNWEIQGQIIQRGGETRQSITTFMDCIGIVLRASDPTTSRRGFFRDASRPVLEFSLSNVEVLSTPNSIACSWCDLVVALDHVAPHYILLSVLAHRGPVLQALKAHKLARQHEIHGAQLRVRQVLKWSSDHAVVDPLSTIQPLYLIQSGRPHELRADTTFKILFFLRNTLRFLDPVERQNIRQLKPEDNPAVTLEETIGLLQGQLTSLAVDADGEGPNLSDVKILTTLFPVADPASLRLRKRLNDVLPTKKGQVSPTSKQPLRDCQDVLFCDVTIFLGRFRLQAAAEKLIVVFGLSGLTLISSAYLRKPQERFDISTNLSIILDSVSLKARSSPEGQNPTARDALASIVVNRIKTNGVARHDPLLNPTIRGMLSVDDARLSVPRSAIHLFRFIVGWRADYLPGIEGMVHALLSEVREKPGPPRSSRTTASKKSPTIQFQAFISSLKVSLHVMPGTWLSWEVFDVVTYLRFSLTSVRKLSRFFGLRLASQRISISAVEGVSIEPSSTERVKLDLPWMAVTGQLEDNGVHAATYIGVFHVTVKPSHWDTLLSVQQKFGQDFNDLILFIEDARRKRPVPVLKEKASSSKSLFHTVSLKVKGFRVGLEGHSSTAFLECQDIEGGMNSDDGTLWHLNVTGLALSLAPHVGKYADESTFSRNHRSAFVIIDFTFRVGHLRNEEKTLQIVVSKIHAVMQPSSIGEIGDFMDHLQAEVLVRQEERARELAGFKEKTRSIMRTFDVKPKDTSADNRSSWDTDYDITFTVKNIGAAFPLAFDQNLELPQQRTTDHVAVGAFLFSIKSLSFGAKCSGSGQATMHGFSFQFVDRFRQSIPADFSGENHQTRNRLIYPEMTAHLRTERFASSRRMRIGANVSGFILDLDPSIADHIFSLIDVYREGKERVAKLASNIPRNPAAQNLQQKVESIATETQHKTLPTSNVLLSLVFLSGRLRMFSGSTGNTLRPSLGRERTKERLVEKTDTFDLPVVSVWGEYRATPASRKLSDAKEADPSSLILKTTIHSSENTLRPTMLPFLSGLVSHVEVRMRKASWRDSHSSTTSTHDLVPTVSSEPGATPHSESGASMQVTFSLRIDQSRLQLTCQPDVNVVAGINWDSGGFVMNISPGARQVSLMGNVGGLTIGLKHGFLSEDCVRLDARDLAFSMTFAKVDQDSGKTIGTVSVVMDTEVAGVVRFSRLQDVLCFKAVWLDRIPVYSGQNAAAATSTKIIPAVSPGGAPSKQELTTAVLVRVRRVAVDVDLGQSITSISFNLQDVSLRSKLQDVSSELYLAVGDLRMLAVGNVSGKAHIPTFFFQTIRRTDIGRIDVPSTSKMLDLSLRTGVLDLVLESDYQKILQLWAEPFEISVFDDWSQISPDISVMDRHLRLSFIVSGTDLVAAATVGTIPKLVSYARKFGANLQAQREGATRESRAYSITQSPKPDNPLSSVANAMLVSARSRLKEAENNMTYIVRQQMKFQLNSLRLVVFPRTMSDVEMAHFIVRDVHAILERVVEAETLPARRELRLSFSSITTSRFSQLNHALLANEVVADLRVWLDALMKKVAEAIIFDLPAMHMFMRTDEIDGENTKTIEYDFVSQFDRKKGIKDQEDIYITLNVALYSWLTVLRKNLARQMDQVQSNSDWKVGVTPIASPVVPRKKTVEPSMPPPEFGLKDAGTTGTAPRPRSPAPPSALLLSPPSPVKAIAKSTSPMGQPNIESDADALGPAIILDSSQKPSTQDSVSALPVSQISSPTPLTGPSASISPAARTSSMQPGVVYHARDRHIERLNMRQLGEATPDVMHPFFMKKAGFNLEDSLPQYVHEYATMPIDEITRALLKLYSKQLDAPERH
ncbi:hypothetical protein EW146_g951 [Bondarzewia mesenterica]|uniref:Csf1 N-terminal domain-containing protein n=1 Tax=Bondarzewia mesenterica TaxID=1095465 RepID=A0A4S4MBN2_9AGAM|nr:hypothetical protein EW146_g951 [Bondarzewia mesenterica]